MYRLAGRTPATAAQSHSSLAAGSAHLTVQPGGKGNTGIKMKGNTLEVELKQKREEKRHAKQIHVMSSSSCLLMTGCKWRSMAQSSTRHSTILGRKELPKSRCSLPAPSTVPGKGSTSQLARTQKQHWLSAVTLPTGRCWPYLTLMEAGARHSHNMAERLAASMCWIQVTVPN